LILTAAARALPRTAACIWPMVAFAAQSPATCWFLWVKSARRPVSRVLSRACARGWPFIWGARCRTPRAIDPDGGAKTRLAPPPKGLARPSLLDLAPGGVCPAAAVAGSAVRSYRTLSPLPARGPKASRPAVCFLWHFPWGRPRRALPGTLSPWSPDFPPPPPQSGGKGGHPAVWPLLARPSASGRQPPPVNLLL